MSEQPGENGRLGSLFSENEESPAGRRVAEGKTKKPVRKWLLLLIGLLTVVLVAGGFYVVRGLMALLDVERDSTIMPSYAGRPVEVPEVGSPMNFVLMGSDSRGEDRGRSDVLMVAHLSADRDKLFIVSFPRDMYVEIPGHGKNKINAAYAFGKEALTIQTLENLLDVRMQHAVLTDFTGFIGLTEQLGGVTVFNRYASEANGYVYPRGEITLKGEQALTYVRERYGLPNGDLDRAERQRTVVKAVALKLMKPQTLADPVKFNAVMSEVGKFFVVDSGLGLKEMWNIATSLKVNSGGDIQVLQAPIKGFGRSPAGASIDLVDFDRIKLMSEALKNDTMADYFAKYGDQVLTAER
ncbi:MAG: LCP family protein [Micropruina sp.]